MRFTGLTATILISILLLVLAGATVSPAAQKLARGPYNIEADLLSYEKDSDTYNASGNVIITFTGGLVKADSITINRQTGNAWAEGNVYLKSDDDVLEGSLVSFNLDEKTGTVYNGKVFFAKNNLYLQGDEIEKKGEATYSLKNADATTCDGSNPPWRLKAKELEVTVDGYGTLKDGSFEVKDTPVLYLPYFIFPAKTTRQSGFLYPRLAVSSKNGTDVEIPFYWAISDSTDATFYQRYMSERGYKQGVDFRYSLSKNTFGTAYVDYIRDNKTESETADSLSRNWQESRNRWSYYLNHETTFSPGFYIRTDVAKVSDHWYFRDFSDFNYYLENYSPNPNRRFERISFRGDQSLTSLDSKARIVKTEGYFDFTALGQYTDDLRFNSNDATLQRYPELSFAAITQPLFNTGLNFEMSSQYDYFYRETGDKGHFGDLYPLLSRPLSFGDYLQITPFTGVRGTLWDSSGTADKNDSRKMLVAGTTAGTEAFRVYNLKPGEGVEKIKHSIKPELNYSYAAVDQGNRPDYVANFDSANILTYSLYNYLTTKSRGKDGKPVYTELMRLKLTQSYDIKRSRESNADSSGQKEFGPVAIEADVNPFNHLVYHADAAYDTNSGDWIKSNHDLTLKDERGDSASIGYRFTKGGSLSYSYLTEPGAISGTSPLVQSAIREINLTIKAKAASSVNLLYILRRNEVDNVSLESTYGIEFRQQCWSVLASYSDTTNDKRFMIVFSLLGLGNVARVGTPGF
jgi:LPS-assembly protein